MEPKRYRGISQSLFNYIGSEAHRSEKARAASRGFKSIDAWYYSSQAAYDFDLKEIIRKSWPFACHIGVFSGPESYFKTEVAGVNLVVVMDDTRKYRAFKNICPHRGAPLVANTTGRFKKRILCRFHGWSFELDGTLSNILHWEDDFPHVTPHSYRLVEYPVDYFEGFLFVKLGGSSPPPSETMAGFRELVSHYDIPGMEMSYEPEDQDYQANWMLIMENDRNADHKPFIYPEYNDLFGYRGFFEILYPRGVWHAALPILKKLGKLWTTRAYQRLLPGQDHLPRHLRRAWLNFSIFPNFAFFIHPEAVDVMQVCPAGSSHSKVRSFGFQRPGGA